MVISRTRCRAEGGDGTPRAGRRETKKERPLAGGAFPDCAGWVVCRRADHAPLKTGFFETNVSTIPSTHATVIAYMAFVNAPVVDLI